MWTKVLVLLFLVVICSCIPLDIPNLVGNAKEDGKDSQYVVIIDAGSSGSRVHAYRFNVPHGGLTKDIKVEEELYASTEPGLSSYADDPEKGADTIIQLVRKADELVPQEERENTPLIVQGTAGLRLLSAQKAGEILRRVRDVISTLGYHVSVDSVNIMVGADEAFYMWYTVNVLRKTMGRDTLGVVELGGGSTQVSYQLSEEETEEYPTSDQYLAFIEKNLTLYAHSYLGLGLRTARAGVRASAVDYASDTKPVCVPGHVESTRVHLVNTSNSDMEVIAANDTDFNACYKVLKEYVRSKLEGPPRGPKGSFVVVSFLHDVVAEAGVLEASNGTISVRDYRSLAERQCGDRDSSQQWACFDATYCYTVLHDIYGVTENQNIYALEKVDGFEVSWALGLGFMTVIDRVNQS